MAEGEKKEKSPEMVSALDVGLRFAKALAAYRFYPPEHAALRDFHVKLLDALTKHSTNFGAFSIQINGSYVEVFNTNILDEENTKFGFTKPLQLSGVRAISFSSDVQVNALCQLTNLWFNAHQKKLPEGHDFYTAFWDADIAGVDLTAVAVPIEGEGLSEEKIELDATKFATYALEEKTHAVRNYDDDPARVARSLGLGGNANAPIIDVKATTVLTAEDLTELSEVLRVGINDRIGHGLQSLWMLLGVASPDEAKALCENVHQIMVRAMAEGQWASLVLSIQRWVADTRNHQHGKPHLINIGQRLINGERNAIVTALKDDQVRPEVLNLLRQMPSAVFNEGYVLVMAIPPGKVREELAALLASRSNSIESLLPLVEGLGAPDVPWVSHLLERPRERAELLPLFTAHSSGAMRALALKNLPFGTRMERPIMQGLADPDPLLRTTALKLAVQHQILKAIPIVVAWLLPPYPDAQRTAMSADVFDALVTFGTRAASQGLIEIAQKPGPDALRVAAIEATIQIGDPLARKPLSDLGGGWRTPRAVKNACKVALTKIGAL